MVFSLVANNVRLCFGFPSWNEFACVPLVEPADKFAGFAVKDTFDSMGVKPRWLLR